MKIRFTRHWTLVGIACIAASSMAVFWSLQNRAVNNYHPRYQTLWQAYFWVDETSFGWFGLDDWRVEGVNIETSIYLGKFEFDGIPLSAPAVAAIGFASINTVGLLCCAGFSFLLASKVYEDIAHDS